VQRAVPLFAARRFEPVEPAEPAEQEGQASRVRVRPERLVVRLFGQVGLKEPEEPEAAPPVPVLRLQEAGPLQDRLPAAAASAAAAAVGAPVVRWRPPVPRPASAPGFVLSPGPGEALRLELLRVRGIPPERAI